MVNIDIIVNAVDRASKTLKGIGDNVKDFGEQHKESFEKMAGIGAVSFGAIVAGAKMATDAYNEAAKNEAILENAIINVAGASQKEVDALKAQAEALQAIGVIGDDTIMVGQAQLATFQVSTGAIGDLTKTMGDYAVATFGANVSAEQMNQTANTFGKLMNGLDLGQLKQQGILMNEAQEAVLKYGTEAEKVATIQEVMSQNLKVTNEMMRDTGVGAAVAFDTAMGDIVESVGGALAPALTDLTVKLMPIVEGIADWISANPELVGNIVMAAGAITGLIAVVGTLGLALPALATGFAFLTGPIGLAIAAVGVLTYVATYMYNNWEDIKGGLALIRDNIQAKASSAMDGILAFATNFGRVLLGIMTGGLSEIVIAVVNNWDAIKLAVTTAMDAVGAFISSKRDAIKGVFSGTLSAIKDVVMGALGELGALFDSGLQVLASAAQSIGDRIKAIFTGVFDGVKSAATTAINRVIEKINSMIATINSVGSAVGVSIKTISPVGGGVERRGVGGPVIAGKPYIVGEN